MFRIKNHQLVDALEFLEKAELMPRASRVRTKLARLLYAKIEDLRVDEMALLDKYGRKDDNGKLVENQGAYTLIEETAAEYHREEKTLLEENSVIDVGELKDKLAALMEELENSDMRLAGKDAVSLDVLLDALESAVAEMT